MIQTKPRAKKGDPVVPCCDCGTRFGRVQQGKLRPARISAARFGFDGQLCSGCYEKHTRRQARVAARIAGQLAKLSETPSQTAGRYARAISRRFRPANSCDLCGVPAEKRFDGSEFGIESEHGGAGRVCGQCREELAEERAVTRHRALASLHYRNPIWTDKTLYVGRESYRLTVLNPHFAESDLTPRAALRLLVIETRKRERKAS